jgi:predicted Zn-dependent peptidase
MLESIEDLKTRPISGPELSQAKSALLSNHRANLETETGLADQVTAIELFDLARDFLSGFPHGVEQVSAERVQEAAKNYLSSTQISGVVVGESQTVKAGLAEFRSFEISEWQESAAKAPSAR